MSFVGSDGGVLVSYFGYTLCPDVCPTTLSDPRSALEDLVQSHHNRSLAALSRCLQGPEREIGR